MNFVLQKDDPKLPSQSRKSDNQAIDTAALTTSSQTNPLRVSQPLTGNAAAASKKRAREPEITRVSMAPEPINTLLLNTSINAPERYGEAKKAKNASEKLMEMNSNISLPLSKNIQQNIPRGKSQNGPVSSAHCLPLVADFSQIPVSQNSAVPHLVGLNGATTNAQCPRTPQFSGSEFESNEEVSPFEQVPSVNPPSVASIMLSSEGFSNSPFSTSTYSEDDTLGAATPGSSQNFQESQSQLYCQNPSQANVGNSSMPLEFNHLQGLGQTNGIFLDVQELDPTLSQNHQTVPNIQAQANTQVLNDVNTFVPRPNGLPQIVSDSTTFALCKIMNPKKEYDKNQKKLLGPRRSEQRIQGGKVGCSMIIISVIQNVQQQQQL